MSAAAVRLSESTWIRTVEIFGVFARRGVEGGCLWYGDRQMGVVEIIGVPRQINRKRNFEIQSDALAELNLRVPDEVSVLAQLHAHPGRRVRQSRWDNQMIVSRNIISIVLPHYGRDPVDLGECGIHRVIDGRWRCLDAAQRAESIVWGDTPTAGVTDLR
jgi:hypothetical protein